MVVLGPVEKAMAGASGELPFTLARLTSHYTKDGFGAFLPLPNGSAYLAALPQEVPDSSIPPLVRLSPDLRIDPDFRTVQPDTGTVRSIRWLGLQPDGKLLAAGRDLRRGAMAGGVSAGSVLHPFFVRITADGSIDPSFAPALRCCAIRNIIVQTHGSMVVLQEGNPLFALQQNGEADPGFNGGVLTGTIEHIWPGNGSHFYASGNSFSYGGTPLAARTLIRLTEAGELDQSFGQQWDPSGSAVIDDVLERPDGSLYVVSHLVSRGKTTAHVSASGQYSGPFVDLGPFVDTVDPWEGMATLADGRTYAKWYRCNVIGCEDKFSTGSSTYFDERWTYSPFYPGLFASGSFLWSISPALGPAEPEHALEFTRWHFPGPGQQDFTILPDSAPRAERFESEASFWVERVGDTSKEATLRYEITLLSSTEPLAFDALVGEFHLAASESKKKIRLPELNWPTRDPDRVFQVRLLPTDATPVFGKSTTTLTLFDIDHSGLVSLTIHGVVRDSEGTYCMLALLGPEGTYQVESSSDLDHWTTLSPGYGIGPNSVGAIMDVFLPSTNTFTFFRTQKLP